jgi:hypothetical protein
MLAVGDTFLAVGHGVNAPSVVMTIPPADLTVSSSDESSSSAGLVVVAASAAAAVILIGVPAGNWSVPTSHLCLCVAVADL